MARASFAEKKRLVDAVRPHFEALAKWSKAEHHKTPVPDEVVLLDMLALSAAEARLEGCPR